MNKIITGECVTVLQGFEADLVELTVFSPPYDGLRDYKGYTFSLRDLGEQLYRVTKPGGVVVMAIQDQTVAGHKSLTSFRTIVDWCDRIGFGLFECCLYKKYGKDGAWWRRRFRVDHEYLPIFVKGKKPKTFDKTAVKIPSKHGGKVMRGGANRNKDGKTVASSVIAINQTKCPGTIWNYANGGDKNALKREHPAVFPDRLPFDCIQIFTKPGDLVLDPMVGSGSTAVAAKALQRNYIGIDLSADYCRLARKRLQGMHTNLIPGKKTLAAKTILSS